MTQPRLSTGRREFVFQTLSFLPLAAGGLSLTGVARAAAVQGNYEPVFFGTAEWRFLNAFAECLIPADDIGPGAIESGVPIFIDKQMDTPYGHGELWYMQPPFHDAAPEFGYQLSLSPRELYKQGIPSVEASLIKRYGKGLADLDLPTQEAALKLLEAGALDSGAIPSKVFFAQVLQNTREGYFADPVYGGNEDMGSWKMINFPGSRGDFTDWVNQYGVEYPYPPASIAGEGG